MDRIHTALITGSWIGSAFVALALFSRLGYLYYSISTHDVLVKERMVILYTNYSVTQRYNVQYDCSPITPENTSAVMHAIQQFTDYEVAYPNPDDCNEIEKLGNQTYLYYRAKARFNKLKQTNNKRLMDKSKHQQRWCNRASIILGNNTALSALCGACQQAYNKEPIGFCGTYEQIPRAYDAARKALRELLKKVM